MHDDAALARRAARGAWTRTGPRGGSPPGRRGRATAPRRPRTPCPASCPGARSTTSRGSTPSSAGVAARCCDGADAALGVDRRARRAARLGRGAGPSARCARPRAGRGRGRRGTPNFRRDGDGIEHASLHLEDDRGPVPSSIAVAARSGSRPSTRRAVDAHAVRGAEVARPSSRRRSGGSRRAGARRCGRRARRRSRGCGRSSRPRAGTASACPRPTTSARGRRRAARAPRRAPRRGRRRSRPSCGRGRPARRRVGPAPGAGSAARTSRAWMPNSPSESRSSVRNVITGRDTSESRSRRACSSRYARELVGDLVLDALVALAVLGRQPDDVLVGHVGARHGHGAVLVHLLARACARAPPGGPRCGRRGRTCPRRGRRSCSRGCAGRS